MLFGNAKKRKKALDFYGDFAKILRDIGIIFKFS